jgi:hypothetical protein
MRALMKTNLLAQCSSGAKIESGLSGKFNACGGTERPHAGVDLPYADVNVVTLHLCCAYCKVQGEVNTLSDSFYMKALKEQNQALTCHSCVRVGK